MRGIQKKQLGDRNLKQTYFSSHKLCESTSSSGSVGLLALQSVWSGSCQVVLAMGFNGMDDSWGRCSTRGTLEAARISGCNGM